MKVPWPEIPCHPCTHATTTKPMWHSALFNETTGEWYAECDDKHYIHGWINMKERAS